MPLNDINETIYYIHGKMHGMEIVFLGVGEAFDETVPNNSHIVLSGTTVLLDCGYSVPAQLWKYNANPSFLDAIYISHRHADHYFGIPALLTRMWEEKRTEPLTIISQRGLDIIIRELIEYGYQGISEKFQFKINYQTVEEHKAITFNELKLEFAPTRHSVKNLAIKISDGKNTVCYSGDGMFSEETEKLYKNSDLVIHEAFYLDQKTSGHACITDLIDMALRNNIKFLALTHLERNLRRLGTDAIKAKLSQKNSGIIIPEPLEKYSF